MASYQSLESTGLTNVGYISKNLKELSSKIRLARTLQKEEFQDALDEIDSFHKGVQELVLHYKVPKEQSAKNFALKNQYRNLVSCHSTILESRAKISELEKLGENTSKEEHQLNEKYEDHENIYKDICGLYEIFKEFEEEEIKKQARIKENLKNDKNDKDNSLSKQKKEIDEKDSLLKDKKEEVIEKKEELQVVCSATKENPKESGKSNWVWVIVIAIIIILIILGIWLISSS
jgi:hypothetical protein